MEEEDCNKVEQEVGEERERGKVKRKRKRNRWTCRRIVADVKKMKVKVKEVKKDMEEAKIVEGKK